jgi:spore maturation protein CgeB
MTEGLDEEFTPYEHFIPYEYGDFKGLKEKIDYFLTHDAEREKIRLAGFEHCKANHTYGHRVREMLKVLRDRGIIEIIL